jgi:methyl-accepting chemotaxis protein
VKAAVLSADDVARRMSEAVSASSGIADHAREAVAQSGEALSLLEKQRASSDAVAAGAEETAMATGALSEAMGDVLNTTALIRDIADMTSMLSLNASIIAAQAGDRALGFGTVADEIRSLATRTRAAVDGIENRAAEARRQLESMSGVVGVLFSTVRASKLSTEETSTVIQKVLEQMNGALTDVGGLAKLINEASQGTRSSRDAVTSIDAEVKSIDVALASQRAAQARLDESSIVMGKNVNGVRERGRQQALSTEALIEGMTRLGKAMDDLVKLAHAQTLSAEGIAGETSRVKTVAERHRSNVDAIAAAVANLDGEARALKQALSTLQLPE